MKRIIILLALLCLEKTLHAQTHTPYIYTIKADSVKITNSCDTAELIIENHTQTVPGFLFNKGRGRTEFKRVLTKVDDSIYVIGVDTLRLSVAWLQGGNKFGSTGKFGTMDYNHIDFYTNNTKQGRWTNIGNLLLGTETDYGYKLAVSGSTFSQLFTNTQEHLGVGDEGPIRLRYSGGGEFISFYFQDRNKKRGYIGTGGDKRPLRIDDSVGVSLWNSPFLSIGTEWPQNASLSVTTPQNSTLDVFNAFTDNGSIRSCLTVKKSGNTVLGDNLFDIGSRLQVIGSAYITDTLKMPNLVSQTDITNYKPVVADASGNIYKMAAWNVSQLNRTPVNDAGYSALNTDYLIAFTSITAPRTVTLPAAPGMANHILIIKDESGAAAANNITINVTAGGTIDGSSSKSITTNYGFIEVYSNGSRWFTK